MTGTPAGPPTRIVVPELAPHEGSWIVTRKAGGTVVGEFFDRAHVERFNGATCQVETIGTYLARVNQAARETRQDGGTE